MVSARLLPVRPDHPISDCFHRSQLRFHHRIGETEIILMFFTVLAGIRCLLSALAIPCSCRTSRMRCVFLVLELVEHAHAQKNLAHFAGLSRSSRCLLVGCEGTLCQVVDLSLSVLPAVSMISCRDCRAAISIADADKNSAGQYGLARHLVGIFPQSRHVRVKGANGRVAADSVSFSRVGSLCRQLVSRFCRARGMKATAFRLQLRTLSGNVFNFIDLKGVVGSSVPCAFPKPVRQ
jgi:hypothetical protein